MTTHNTEREALLEAAKAAVRFLRGYEWADSDGHRIETALSEAVAQAEQSPAPWQNAAAPAMRKTTRDEKIVRPGVYEVPYTSFETWFKSVQKYIEPQDMEQWLNAAFDAGRAGVERKERRGLRNERQRCDDSDCAHA
jgi:hypothetical protein